MFLIFLLLVNLGVSHSIASYTITSLVWLLITYSGIKAKEKIKFVVTFCFNLLIICVFWYIISKSFSLEIIFVFIGNYILISFEDFDFSDIVNSLGLHKKCFGDPGGPGGNGDPDLNPFFCSSLWMDKNETYVCSDLPRSQLYDLPGLKDFKNYVIHKGVEYKTSTIQEDIKQYNKKVVLTSEDDMWLKKQLIIEDIAGLNKYFLRATHDTPLQFVNSLQSDIYMYTLEYNTLQKAKLFYEKDGAGLTEDYEYAFELWQKRQIKSCLNTYTSDLKAKKPVFEITDYFINKNVYEEVLRDLLYIELYLIQMTTIYDNIKSEKFNFFKLKVSDFDEFVLSISKSHVNNECYKEAHELVNNCSHIKTLSKPAVDLFYENYVPIKYKFYTQKIELGLGLASKFANNKFSITEFKTISKSLFAEK